MVESGAKPNSRCSVCFDEKNWKENPLVFCEGCNVVVHQACYGILKVPEGMWHCQTCESQERMARVRCELCPLKGGALKRTDNNGWAHVVCALYIPEVRFANTRTMEPIIISRIPREKYSKSCHICEEGNQERNATIGACMSCNWASCRVSFHVTCAQNFGLLTEEEESRDGSTVRFCGYCPTHLARVSMNDRRKTVGLTAASLHTHADALEGRENVSCKRRQGANQEESSSKRAVLSSESTCSKSDSESNEETLKIVTKEKKTTSKQEAAGKSRSGGKRVVEKETKKRLVHKQEIIKSKVHPLSRQVCKSHGNKEQKSNRVVVPDSLEKMLEKQWEQTSGFIMEQGASLGEIDTLLTSLHSLQNENLDLKNRMHGLSIKTDRFQASNLYLSSLLTMHAVGQISSKIPQFKPPELTPPKPHRPRKRNTKATDRTPKNKVKTLKGETSPNLDNKVPKSTELNTETETETTAKPGFKTEN